MLREVWIAVLSVSVLLGISISPAKAQWQNLGPVTGVKQILPTDTCSFRLKTLLTTANERTSTGYQVAFFNLDVERDSASRVGTTGAIRQTFLSAPVGGKLGEVFSNLVPEVRRLSLTNHFITNPADSGELRNYKLQIFFFDELNVQPSSSLLVGATLKSRRVSGSVHLEQMSKHGSWSNLHLVDNLDLSRAQLQINCGSLASASPSPSK
jgi:hypothetical protein